MSQSPTAAIIGHFEDLTDPRLDRKKLHKLQDIVVIAILAVICGADGWAAVESFGKGKYEWLKTFLELPNGIPSHDTFGRVFALLSPVELQRCFMNWIQAVAEVSEGQIIAIDGKTLRRSYDRGSDKAAIHMVSAWAAANRVVLGQLKTDEKSNEITAIPELLKLLDIKGCIVTIDAMGCQKNIAKQIVDKGADYVLALKGNQGNLAKAVEQLFTQANANSFRDPSFDYYETKDVNHGRREIRRYWTTDNLEGLDHKA